MNLASILHKTLLYNEEFWFMHRDQIFDSACRQILLQKLALYLLTFLVFLKTSILKQKLQWILFGNFFKQIG